MSGTSTTILIFSNPALAGDFLTSSYVIVPTSTFKGPNSLSTTEYKTISTLSSSASVSNPETTPSSTSDPDLGPPSVTSSPVPATDVPTSPPVSNNLSGPVSTSSTDSGKQTGVPSAKKGISGGAAAGIGIGGVIIGALIALLFAFIFMKRSRKHRSSRHSSTYDTEKPPLVPIAVDETLLDRADDSQLRKSMQELNELIDQHVENNYHLQPFDSTSQGSLERRLVEAGYTAEPSASDLVSILRDPRTRFAGIREVIAKILIGNLEVKARSEGCLLPPQIVGFVKCIPPVERLGGADEVYDKAFTKWRHLSAFLIEPSRTSREAPKANERDLQGAIARNVAVINSILKPFINPGPEGQRSQEKNLSAIIFEGAQLGLLLFAQPSVWVFGWRVPLNADGERRAGRPFVVFPSLSERIERNGRQRLREVASSVVVEL